MDQFFNSRSLGRWLSEDPLGFGGSDVNLFEYVTSNPLRLPDPSGFQALYPRPILPGPYTPPSEGGGRIGMPAPRGGLGFFPTGLTTGYFHPRHPRDPLNMERAFYLFDCWAHHREPKPTAPPPPPPRPVPNGVKRKKCLENAWKTKFACYEGAHWLCAVQAVLPRCEVYTPLSYDNCVVSVYGNVCDAAYDLAVQDCNNSFP